MTDKRIDLMQNWLVEETRIHPEAPRKFESILCLGNGYMGVRAATDESYEKTVRYTLVAGTFDKMERKNTTELPNAADTTAVYLTADGIPLTLTPENHSDYKRCLNLHSGLLTRTFQWQTKAGVRIRFLSERFVSLADLHLLVQRISVKVLGGETDLCLACGIQGGERYGEPHFRNKEGRTEGNLLQYAETTHESGITFVTSAYVRAECDGKAVPLTHQLSADRLLAGCRLRLNRLLDLDRKIAGWQEGVQKLKLPAATADHVLPQDDDYMTLPEIDLTPYRAGEKKLRQDYPYPTYTRLKVSKQADVMNLFLLREEMFPETVKKASLRYYEPFCVHESSLSLCAYSMLAADCGEQKQAYDLFARARAIDLGPNMRSSDEGIHAASLGGVWQCCVLGFCGVRLCADQLRIIPNLPESWTGVTVRIWWRGSQLELTVTHKAATVRVLQGNPELSVLTSKGLQRGSGSISWEL